MLPEKEENFKQVKQVLWWVLGLNILVAVLKIVVGLLSGIISMVADGFHSLMDGSSNIIGLVAIHIAQAPPDDNHPYGHRKAETLAALFIGVLLLFTAFEILKNASNRLFEMTVPDINQLSFVVMGVTIVINLAVTWYEHHRGKALDSEILLTDAEHTRTDVLVSLSVVIGLVGVWQGFVWLDAVVGLGIALFIGWSAFKILSHAVHTLMDHAALPHDDIEQLALALPEVQSVERIRSRGPRHETYVDMHVRVRPDLSLDYAHSVAHAVQDRIKLAYPQTADVTVHIEPQPVSEPDRNDINRQLKGIAHSLGTSAHDIWVYRRDGQLKVELHLEVPPRLSLSQAHALASEMERRSQQLIPNITNVTTHIEPMGGLVENFVTPPAERIASLKLQATDIANEICGQQVAHNIQLHYRPQLLALSLHCTLPPQMPIVEAHSLSQRIEDALRQELPQLDRITVHVEPPTMI